MGIRQWTIVETPDSVPVPIKAILNPNEQGSEINKIAIAPDGITMWAIVRRGDRNGVSSGGSQTMLYRSTDGGLSWNYTPYNDLVAVQSGIVNGTFIWDIALAPDDSNIIAVACADIQKDPLAQEVWLSTDRGLNWRNTKWFPRGIKRGIDLISTMDISTSTGGCRILVGTRDGTGLDTNNLQIMEMSNYGIWNIQDGNTKTSLGFVAGDILVAKFSPNFDIDRTLIVVYSDGNAKPDHRGTWLATGVYDALKNSTNWQPQQEHIEIRNSNSNYGDSPRVCEIVTASLGLPSDFSGQESNFRRFYVSTDAVDREEGTTLNRGLYRIDDNTVYTLMDNTGTYGSVSSPSVTRRISSIAYCGTCNSGKLLVGEVLGNALRATAPTWFTDSPAIYPTQWFTALKPTSGSAGQSFYPGFKDQWGYCNVQVAWSPAHTRQGIAYAATGSASLGPWATPSVSAGTVIGALAWPAGFVNVVPFDESAFSITRDHGTTWNQLSLINTGISRLTDVAPAPNSHTVYLASVNLKGRANNIAFDSVWRSSLDASVIQPLLPPSQLGSYWERVLCYTTADKRNTDKDKHAILRLAPQEPAGECVFFALRYADTGDNDTNVILWSPDYGDFWAEINPGIPVQDLAAASRTLLYVVATNGQVQKLAYTGKNWTTVVISDTGVIGHIIQALVDNWVIVGNQAALSALPAFVYSNDGAKTWKQISRPAVNANGRVHVAFDSNFYNNMVIYAGFDGASGSIYRWIIGKNNKWFDLLGNAAATSDHKIGCRGLCIAHTGEALYSVHIPGQELPINSVVRRIVQPLGVMQESDNLQVLLDDFQPPTIAGVNFAGEPYSVKLSGCMTIDTDTNLFAIDARNYVPTKLEGMLWTYTDIEAKRGSAITMGVIGPISKGTIVAGQGRPKLKAVMFDTEIPEEHIRELTEKLSKLTTPIILTEGKTDVKILEIAWQNLYPNRARNFEIQSCDPVPFESNTGGAGGVATLRNRIITVPHTSPNKLIAIFDRDREGIKAFGLDGNFKPFNSMDDQKVHLNRRAYALLVPVPNGMEEFKKFSNLPIEFLFEAQYLRKKVDNKGLALTAKKIETRVDGQTIDERQGDRLALMDIEKDSKKWFSEKVVPTLPTKAFKNFTFIFDVIGAMIND